MAITRPLHELSVAEAGKAMRAGELTSVALTQHSLGRIATYDGDIHAFVLVTAERALSDAAQADKDFAAGIDKGPMQGIPYALKDIYGTAGIRTTCHSNLFRDHVPTADCAVQEKLAAGGGVLMGKVGTFEFAIGGPSFDLPFPPARNPWNTAHFTGGSSSGSGAAVAAGMVRVAMGSDTGGSIRWPAALCGTVGLKPTYGRCSRWGIVAFASSLDQAGPMTRTVRDAAILLRHMASVDPNDSTSVDIPVPDYEATLENGVKGLRVGIPKEYRIDGAPPEIDALWEKGAEWLKAQGAEIVEVSLPHTKYALPTYYIVAPAEASSNLARYDGVRFGYRADGARDIVELYEKSRGEGFGAEVQRRILIGTYVLSAGYYDAYYARAQKLRTLIARDFTNAFEKCDVLLTPATPGPAFAIGAKNNDPLSMYLNDVFTVTVNLAGLPGLAVPAGLTADGLPLGLQIIGKAFDEATVLRVGRSVEKAAEFGAKPQKWWTA